MCGMANNARILAVFDRSGCCQMLRSRNRKLHHLANVSHAGKAGSAALVMWLWWVGGPGVLSVVAMRIACCRKRRDANSDPGRFYKVDDDLKWSCRRYCERRAVRE